MKRLFLIALLALTSAVAAHAQGASADTPNRFEFGLNPVSYLHQGGKDLWGGSVSLAMRRSDRLSYLLDVTFHQTNETNAFLMSAYRFGVRYYTPRRGKIAPFAEIMAGGANTGAITTTITTTTGTTSTTVPGHNGVSFATGGGVDYVIRPWFSWRTLQVDYSLFHVTGSTTNGVRIQTGAVFHFGH